MSTEEIAWTTLVRRFDRDGDGHLGFDNGEFAWLTSELLKLGGHPGDEYTACMRATEIASRPGFVRPGPHAANLRDAAHAGAFGDLTPVPIASQHVPACTDSKHLLKVNLIVSDADGRCCEQMLETAYARLLSEVTANAMPMSVGGCVSPYSPQSAPCTPVLRPRQLCLSSPVSTCDFQWASTPTEPATPQALPIARQLWPQAAQDGRLAAASAEREAAQAFGVGVRMDPEHFWEELLDDDDDDDDDECMEGIEVGSKALHPEIYQAAMSSFTFAKAHPDIVAGRKVVSARRPQRLNLPHPDPMHSVQPQHWSRSEPLAFAIPWANGL